MHSKRARRQACSSSPAGAGRRLPACLSTPPSWVSSSRCTPVVVPRRPSPTSAVTSDNSVFRCTLHAGQLRWKQTAHLDNSSSSSRQQPGEQQAEGEGEVAQRQLDPDAQQQIDYDVQQLAQDVFHKGQVLAGGRWERASQAMFCCTHTPVSQGRQHQHRRSSTGARCAAAPSAQH